MDRCPIAINSGLAKGFAGFAAVIVTIAREYMQYYFHN